jgi:peptidoglycan/LPS O-acetylase OafA/YrhL
MRGVAAFAVVLFHFMEWVYPDSRQNFIEYGFLAVDFFFCLSGFVIGYAYDDRLGMLGVWAFFKARLIRLHPLVVLGSMLGLVAFLFDPFEAYPSGYSAGKIMQAFVCAVLLIPFPMLENRSFNLFGLNAPAWSLFWEYVATIVYALFLYQLARRYLVVLTLLAAATLCLVSYRAGNLLGGWAGENFWDGGARITYSFCAGLLLYRSKWVPKNRLGFSGLASLLLLAFLMPHVSWNWLAEALVVIGYFPLLVALGAGASASLSARVAKGCAGLGNISYPLYMTHYAAIWLFGHYFTRYKPSNLSCC